MVCLLYFTYLLYTLQWVWSYSTVLLLKGGTSDGEFRRTWLQLEAREQELDRLESKMMTGAKLLASKDSRLRQLEFSLLDNNAVCGTIYLPFYCGTYFVIDSLCTSHLYWNKWCVHRLVVILSRYWTGSKRQWTVLSDLLRQVQAAYFNCILDFPH